MIIEFEFRQITPLTDVRGNPLLCDMCDDKSYIWWCEALCTGYCQGCLEEVYRLNELRKS